MNTDRGPQFFANTGEAPSSAHTQFGRYLAGGGIRHVVSRVNHPQTKDYPAYCTSGKAREGFCRSALALRRLDHFTGLTSPRGS